MIIQGLPDEEYYWQVEVSESPGCGALGFLTLRIPRCWGLRALIRVKELIAAGADDVDGQQLADEGYIDFASAMDPEQQPPAWRERHEAECGGVVIQ